MAADRSNVYVAVSDVELSVVSPGVPGAQPSAFNPKMAFLYNNKVGGGLWALKLATGEEIWRTPHPGCADVPGCSPGQSAAVTAIPGVVFSGGLDGRLRAYSSGDGHIVWDMDTKGEYPAVNGVETKGGSMDGGGPVIVGGTLYVTSGSGQLGAILVMRSWRIPLMADETPVTPDIEIAAAGPKSAMRAIPPQAPSVRSWAPP